MVCQCPKTIFLDVDLMRHFQQSCHFYLFIFYIVCNIVAIPLCKQIYKYSVMLVGRSFRFKALLRLTSGTIHNGNDYSNILYRNRKIIKQQHGTIEKGMEKVDINETTQIKWQLPFPHLLIWLVTGSSSTHWHDLFFESHIEPGKLHSCVLSHLSPNIFVPRLAASVSNKNYKNK